MKNFDNKYLQDSRTILAGTDEAGRGPLAGPVVAGAVVLPKGKRILYVNDSKKLSEKKREELFDVIKEEKDKVEKLIKDIMENCYKLDVPLKVEVTEGSNWYETH